MTNYSFKQYYRNMLERFESYLEQSLPPIPKQVSILSDSMKYSLLAGGKRIRPILLLTTIECTNQNSDFALPFASAIEYIHSYSLIHDDLPCMDNDSLRRGKPTNHIQFGEEIALLAGDALLTHCFYLITTSQVTNKIPPETIIRIINILAEKSGVFGMVSGQIADIKNDPNSSPKEALDFIHKHKTGALITASIQIGALLANTNETDFQILSRFGEEIGKCFQIQDDILDVVGSKEKLGKSPGSDERNNTLSFPSIYGLDKSYELANRCYEKAISHLSDTELPTTRLNELADFVLKRDH